MKLLQITAVLLGAVLLLTGMGLGTRVPLQTLLPFQASSSDPLYDGGSVALLVLGATLIAAPPRRRPMPPARRKSAGFPKAVSPPAPPPIEVPDGE